MCLNFQDESDDDEDSQADTGTVADDDSETRQNASSSASQAGTPKAVTKKTGKQKKNDVEQTTPAAKRKKPDDVEVELLKQLVSTVSQPSENNNKLPRDSDDTFGQYVATELRSIECSKTKALLKGAINSAITQAQLGILSVPSNSQIPPVPQAPAYQSPAMHFDHHRALYPPNQLSNPTSQLPASQHQVAMPQPQIMQTYHYNMSTQNARAMPQNAVQPPVPQNSMRPSYNMYGENSGAMSQSSECNTSDNQNSYTEL